VTRWKINLEDLSMVRPDRLELFRYLFMLSGWGPGETRPGMVECPVGASTAKKRAGKA